MISHLKYEIRGEVLLINDITLVNKAEELISFIEPSKILTAPVILMLLCFSIFFIVLRQLKIKTSRKKSLILFLILGGIVYFSFGNKYLSNSILKFFGLDTEIRYNINSIHKENGVILGLYTNIIMNEVQIPKDYNKEKVYEILENIEINENSENSENNVKPNVIMIMSESFFDPTVLKGISFSKEPIPNIKSLLEEYTSGKFISSTFAGGTSNIEFEAFTGQSIAHLPYGMVPYMDLKENISEIDTLPKIMKDNGYKTYALHTYDKTFYDRDINYPNMGFDTYIGVDELYNPQYFGKYVSDETFTDNIIKIIEDNNADNNNQPLFIWGVTMQNHTPYTTSNYSHELEIKVSGENLTDNAKDTLAAYVNGLHNSDKAIKKLIDYLENTEVPTVVLFFGDHLPSLYDVYMDTKLINTKDTTKWNTAEMLAVHTLPFFIYDNFNFKQEYSNDKIVGTAFLGNYLCNYVGLNKPLYFEFLDTLKFIAIRDRLFVDEEMKPNEKVTKEYEEMVNNHKIMQYDSLYGEKFINEFVKEDEL